MMANINCTLTDLIFTNTKISKIAKCQGFF